MSMTGVARAVGLAAVGCIGAALALSVAVQGEEKTSTGQSLLPVDWADPELAGFKRNAAIPGGDDPRLKGLKLPVLAFTTVPQIVKNVAGPDARPVKPRAIVTDPKQPYWYQLVDTYDGITVSIDADRRINLQAGKNFRIGAANKGAAATLGTKSAPRITILDNSSEEGMEGMLLEYTLQKFPDIPYTVTIECSRKAKTQCKDLAVITKDEALLGVITANGP